MKEKWKTLNTREFVRILLNNGFTYVSSRGGHDKYSRDGKIVIVNSKTNKMVMRRLIKENNLVLR